MQSSSYISHSIILSPMACSYLILLFALTSALDNDTLIFSDNTASFYIADMNCNILTTIRPKYNNQSEVEINNTNFNSTSQFINTLYRTETQINDSVIVSYFYKNESLRIYEENTTLGYAMVSIYNETVIMNNNTTIWLIQSLHNTSCHFNFTSIYKITQTSESNISNIIIYSIWSNILFQLNTSDQSGGDNNILYALVAMCFAILVCGGWALHQDKKNERIFGKYTTY